MWEQQPGVPFIQLKNLLPFHLSFPPLFNSLILDAFYWSFQSWRRMKWHCHLFPPPSPMAIRTPCRDAHKVEIVLLLPSEWRYLQVSAGCLASQTCLYWLEWGVLPTNSKHEIRCRKWCWESRLCCRAGLRCRLRHWWLWCPARGGIRAGGDCCEQAVLDYTVQITGVTLTTGAGFERKL